MTVLDDCAAHQAARNVLRDCADLLGVSVADVVPAVERLKTEIAQRTAAIAAVEQARVDVRMVNGVTLVTGRVDGLTLPQLRDLTRNTMAALERGAL